MSDTFINEPVRGFNVSAFKSNLKRRGLMGTNLFMAYFPIPSGMNNRGNTSTMFTDVAREMNLWCDGGSIPEVFLNTINVRRFGYGPTNKQPTHPVFKDLPLTFLVDANANTWRFFHEWMSLVTNFNTENGVIQQNGNISGIRYPAYETGYFEDFATNVAISAFSDDGSERMRIILNQAWPIGLSEITLGWGDKSNIARFTVLFNMIDWYDNTDPAFSPA